LWSSDACRRRADDIFTFSNALFFVDEVAAMLAFVIPSAAAAVVVAILLSSSMVCLRAALCSFYDKRIVD
jgi:hypothetical protein